MILLSYTSNMLAQVVAIEEPMCVSEQANMANLILDKDYAKSQRLFEEFYQKRTQEQGLLAEKTSMVYTIPTVVHIVHSCAELGTINNPDDTQVRAIIEEMNQRFAHTQAGAQAYSNPNYGVDTEIEFCLVDVAPSGNYTTGIVRHPDSENHVGSYSQLRAAYGANYRWDRTKYFNIFIATDLTDASGVYLGGSSSDFIICDASAFTSGLVAHEAGHYLSLRHTFGGCGNTNCLASGDFVCDTPPKNSPGLVGAICEAAGNNCTTDDDDTATYNPYRPTSMGGMGDQVDMLENYMDYTESCWDAFTLGQKNRMRLNIEASRLTMVNTASTVCTNVNPPSVDIAVTKVTTNLADCTSSFAPSVTFKNEGTSTINSATIEITNAGMSSSVNWTGNLSPGATTSISLPDLNLVTGLNTITAIATLPNGTSDIFTNNNEACTTVAYPSPTGLDLPFIDDFSSCALNPFYNLDNGEDVIWSLTNYSTPAGLTDCQDCYARVLGFATPAETAQFCLPKFDFSSSAGPTIKFLMGHIPRYTFITDLVDISVSKNCGIPSTIWSASALQLATNTPPSYSPNSVYAYPTCNEMKLFEVDLSAFAFETNVEICFEASGRWYSPLIIDELSVEDNSTKQLAIKAMLGGAYNSGTGLMEGTIRALGNFPLTEPYSSMGYQYVGSGGGETIPVTVLYPNDADAIVDWVVLEVRSPNDPSVILSSRAALLQRDGDIVDLNGKDPVQVTGIASGNYYVAVRHRNHLGTMTTLVNIQ